MIPTFTGKCVDPFHPRIEDICIEDIAHHLALVNRFAGATKFPISVAQHSVYVARLVEGPDEDPPDIPCRGNPLALQGLLHDASEAYLGDITVFLKRNGMFDRYRRVEHLLQSAIYSTFGCVTVENPKVKEADYLMARYEALQMFGPDFQFCGNKDGYADLTREEFESVGNWKPWSWRMAEEVFLAEYKRFSNYDY